MASDSRDPDVTRPVLKNQFLGSLERIPETSFGLQPGSAFYAGSQDQDIEGVRDPATTDRSTTSWLLAIIVGLAVDQRDVRMLCALCCPSSSGTKRNSHFGRSITSRDEERGKADL
ncbi:hypothetical protein BST61_g6042 [Cercospora zeina]